MTKLSQEELRKVQIGILKAFKEFCVENNLNWWIESGTLLGAVRHKGYIPWDDDIDVSMMRTDYNHVVELFNKWSIDCKSGQYLFLSPETENCYDYPFGKIIDTSTILFEYAGHKIIKIGVYIDVFPFDNAPADKRDYYKMLKRRNIYGKLLKVKMMGRGSFSYKGLRALIIKVLLLPFPVRLFVTQIVNNAKKFDGKRTGKIGDFIYPYGNNDFYLDEDFFEDLIFLKFEDDEYPAPKRFHEWLTMNYGDYMQIPPKDKQVHHNIEAYYKE